MQSFTLSIALFFILLISDCPLQAQTAASYRPLNDEAASYQECQQLLDNKYRQDLRTLPSQNRKYFEELYKERYERIRKMFADNEIVAAPEANAYLQSLLKAVVNGNPSLQTLAPRVYFSRAWWPNASSQGEGTILFNIGLFTRLQNESQAAFVLCHELAHLYLDHSNKSIDRYVNTVYSDEFQKELRKIKNSEYLRGKQLEGLVKGLAFRNRRHSREHESEADLLAFEWLKNTPFHAGEALTALQLLDSVDQDKYNVSPPLEKVFDFPQYPFQRKWTEEEKTLFSAMAVHSEEEAAKERDSLKTHPDCAARVDTLKARMQLNGNNGQASPINGTLFRQLQQTFDYEIIEHCYRSDLVARSLLYSLQMLEFHPGDPYLVMNTGRCLNKLYKGQKEHTLSKLVDMPSPYLDSNYNKLLTLIQRVRLIDLGAFSYYYLAAIPPAMAGSEDFLEALIRSKENFNRPEERQQWIDYYHKHFPQGKYSF